MNELHTSSLLTTLLAMAGFALVGAITPGPVNVLALRHGSQGPGYQALLYVLGASLSYVVVVACMGLGSARLLGQHPGLAHSAQWLCAAYLLWLAWQLARAPASPSAQPSPAAHPTEHPRPWQAFTQGVAVQMLNPKAWLFALSAVGLYALPQSPLPYANLGWLCAISLVACLIGVGCWAVLGRILVRWLHTPQRQRALNLALALLLVVSVVTVLA
ncbi:MAG: LysE family translocator [Comamonas sp.]|uniref:LysE family translocator n=1 Tax=Comamonas sp. TaxID=34028 RepID=UPI002FCB8819